MGPLKTITVASLACVVAACSSSPEPTIPAPAAPTSQPQSVGPPLEPADPSPGPSSAEPSPFPVSTATHTFTVTEHETFNEPWAMTFLPGTDILAITEKGGRLLLRDAGGIRQVSGVPDVSTTKQGGLADIIAGADFETDQRVYLSWVEARGGLTGGVVGTATLDVSTASLSGLREIWRQDPFGDREGHYSLRLATDGQYLFLSSGDRQERRPAQSFESNLGKILRLNLDGTPAAGNPFRDEGDTARQFWSIGHRNPLGLAFDADGRLWSSEMGPRGGDEFNLIREGLNYGWPTVSNGSNYDGSDIPDHSAGDGFEPPMVFWNPSISPGSLMIYRGDLFPAWRGDAFLGGLSGQVLIRVDLHGDAAQLAESWPMEHRIREVEEAPDGSIWMLRDGRNAKLLELRPA